jgi:hypothetical protein
MARLALAVTKREQCYSLWKKYEAVLTHSLTYSLTHLTTYSLTQEVVRKQDRLLGISSRINQFKNIVDDVKQRWYAAQEEEKNLEKTFKRDIQTLCNISFDQDTLKVFTQLYRKRKYPKIEGTHSLT